MFANHIINILFPADDIISERSYPLEASPIFGNKKGSNLIDPAFFGNSTDKEQTPSIAPNFTPENILSPDQNDGSSTIDMSRQFSPLEPQKKSKVTKGVRFEGVVDAPSRSRSLSGRSNRVRRRTSRRKHASEDAVEGEASHSTHRLTVNNKKQHRSNSRNRHKKVADENVSDDACSDCSTCSSSSSSSDDYVYQLPQRRHYGGVRVSYIPNDAIACARQRKQQLELDRDNKSCIIS